VGGGSVTCILTMITILDILLIYALEVEGRMTQEQIFFSLAGLIVTVALGLAGFVKHYLDAKIDPIGQQVRTLVDYMVSHEGKIATLEERTRNR